MKNALAISILLMTVNASATSYLEPLLGLLRDAHGVTFQVFSGGCTHKEDFAVRHGTSNGETTVGLYRINPDHCLAYYSYGIQLQYSYEELGVDPSQRFNIVNPVSD